jgi:hypothetical protein
MIQTINNLQYFVVITKKRLKEKLLSLLIENEAHMVETMYVKGSISHNLIIEAFGLEEVDDKIMISCLLKYENAKEIMELLCYKFKFNKSNTGIAFTVNVEGLLF